jgi:hypothetical protein
VQRAGGEPREIHHEFIDIGNLANLLLEGPIEEQRCKAVRN